MAGLSKTALATALLLLLPLGASAAPAPGVQELTGAKYFLGEFEKEVKAQNGGNALRYRNEKEALSRVQALVLKYPDDPEVKELYARTRTVILLSMGGHIEITPDMLAYRKNEKELVQTISALSEAEWNRLLAGRDIREKNFPITDPLAADGSAEKEKGRYVVLDEVLYPMNQFYGSAGEFIHVGKPSSGFYYVSLSGRRWRGPYEAVRRYRSNVDASLGSDLKFKVLGKITGAVMDIPQAGTEKTMGVYWGWVVEPVALYIPGHALAVYDEKHETGGTFTGEERVAAIKDGWFTVRSVPADVSPEELMRIFSTAIKEKNYELYLDCIDPERQKTPVAQSLIRYHWDLHQERFAREYVEVRFDKARVTVASGYDSGSGNLQNFFLNDDEKEKAAMLAGDKLETADVKSRAYTEKGAQLGSPKPHKLVRRNGGRWYVDDYAARF